MQYGCDALHYALESSVYKDCSFLDDLRSLLRDFRGLNNLKQIIGPHLDQDLDYDSLTERYKANRQANYPLGIWLTSGLLQHMSLYDRLSHEKAKFLSNLLPDIIFGMPSAPRAPESSGYTEIADTAFWENYAESCSLIAGLAWMPSNSFLFSYSLRAGLEKANPNRTRHDVLWQLLYDAGLLQIHPSPLTIFHFGFGIVDHQPSVAIGCCLYIKASLIERLHLFPKGCLSPNILEWSIALSKHVAPLLSFLDSELDADEQVYIIGSLTKLVDTLLNAATGQSHSQAASIPNQESIMTAQASSGPPEAAVAHTQLKALVESGILQVFCRHFANDSPSISIIEHILDEAKWYRDLAKITDRLARAFPKQASSSENSFYSDIVAYYEAHPQETDEDSTVLMLDTAKRLRHDMIEQQV